MGIKLKRSAVPDKVPILTDLELGEVAVNTNDGRMFTKKSGGGDAVVEIGGVNSVAGKRGAVDLVKADVGLANVNNTSDADKPISTATGAALDTLVAAINEKVPAARSIATGTGLTGGGDLSTNRTLELDFDSEANAIAGVATDKPMNALRVAQAIAAQAGNVAPTAGSTHKILQLIGDAVSLIATSETTYPGSTDGVAGHDFVRSMGIQCFIDGTIRVSLDQRAGTSSTSVARVLKNGTQLQEWTTTSTSSAVRTLDVSVAAGDCIVIQQRTASGTTNQSILRAVKILSGTPAYGAVR